MDSSHAPVAQASMELFGFGMRPPGSWLRTGRADRRYERLDITGLAGITSAQRTALLALGAIDHSE